MVKINWVREAKNDLREIYDFIASDSKKYAKYQILAIKKRIEILKVHPYAGKKVEEFDEEELREIVVSHYRIIYKVVSENLIHILLIHHGARKFPREN